MLEDAVSQVLHYEIDDIDRYIRHRNYTVIKLHGSVNWGRELDDIQEAPNNQQTLIDK